MNIVESKRIQYTSSKFAKESLLYLQEVGFSKSLKQHTNSRKHMESFLFFTVLEGDGLLTYQENNYYLKKGDCIFIDCHKQYSHSSDNWQIAWLHFNGTNLKGIYDKYMERGGNIIFSSNTNKYIDLINKIYDIAESGDYLKDMNIYTELVSIINHIMSETIYPDNETSKSKYDIKAIKSYIDDNYTDNLTLESVSSIFYINKFYLTRIFKEKYGTTINNYILEKRITKAKELLRFTDHKIEKIANQCGIQDNNYFSRLFSKVEGISPKEYRKLWKQ